MNVPNTNHTIKAAKDIRPGDILDLSRDSRSYLATQEFRVRTGA